MVSKKVAVILAIVFFIGALAGSYLYFSKQLGNQVSVSKYKSPGEQLNTQQVADSGPKTEACPMNGALYSVAQRKIWEQRRPLGIMIENHTDARPQSGLSSADVIYEAVAEGGITRFLTIFYCQDVSPVGPVRSARIYFLRILEGYGNYPLYAHVGGANTNGPADALGEIRDLGWDQYSDLNQFGVPFPYYYRDYERLANRATEHTMYSATAKLWEFARKQRKLTNVDDKGKAWDAAWTPWKFKADAKAENRGTTNMISFDFWSQFGNQYAVVWNYDKTTNSYKRVNAGVPQMDKDTGKQLASKNVAIVFAKESPANDGYPGGHLIYTVIGSGDGLLFQDGKTVKVTWNKKDEKSMMRFYDPTGKEVSLVRGQVFVEILPIGNKVTY